MGKEYAFDKVTPEMSGSITYWAKELGMGAANIRTAVRQKKLKATLTLNPDVSSVSSYVITGADVLEWRANSGRKTTGEAKPAKPKGAYKYRTSESLTVEQVTAVNQLLLDNSYTLQLVKSAPKGAPKATPADAPDLPEPEEIEEEESASGKGFGLFKRK